MGERTAISWCQHTFNGWWGCVKVSDECRHCYAEELAGKYGADLWGPTPPRRLFGSDHWREPVKWNAAAARDRERRRVFGFSMADYLEDDHPARRPDGSLTTIEAVRQAQLWPLIREATALDWLLLTKREENILPLVPAEIREAPHVWTGTSVGTRKRLPAIDTLRAVPANIRFLSVEPLLEDLGPLNLGGIDWVIVGGESGSHIPQHPERRMDHAWARAVRDQCEAAGVAVWFKQSSGYRTEMGTALEEADGSVWEWRQLPGRLTPPTRVR